MYWVLQENCFDEEQFDTLISVLARLKIPHSVHKLVPFSHDLIPDVNPDGKVIVMGSLTMSEAAAKKGWKPGVYANENFDYRVQVAHWGDKMLNCEGVTLCNFGDIPEQEGDFFLRPIHDTKAMNGTVWDWREFQGLRSRVEGGSYIGGGQGIGPLLAMDTPVLVAPVKPIQREWRLWIVNRRIATYSLYRAYGNRVYVREPLPRDVEMFVSGLLGGGMSGPEKWVPIEAFVLDVAETEQGPKILEVNTINHAGFYQCQVSALVEALEDLGNRRSSK